jgi:hypothetical protein
VTVSYNYLSSGIPQSTTYIKGALSDDIRAWVTKQSASGDKRSTSCSRMSAFSWGQHFR